MKRFIVKNVVGYTIKGVITLLMFLVIILLAGCVPDENTADDIQIWYDQCELIESCSAKIDELREGELSESEIIAVIQADIAEHELRLTEAEAELERQRIEQERIAQEQAEQLQRIIDLEYRVEKLENLEDVGVLSDYLRENNLSSAIRVLKIDGGNFEIRIDVAQIKGFIYSYEENNDVVLTIGQVREILTTKIIESLNDVTDKDTIFIIVEFGEGVVETYTLQELIDNQNN